MSLDRPVLYLVLFLLIAAAEHALRLLNLRHLRGREHAVPDEFSGRVEASALERIVHYTADQNLWALVVTLYGQALLVTFFFGGGLNWVQTRLAGWGERLVAPGVLLGLALGLAWVLLHIPFDLFRTFRLEQAYGFNTQTPGRWVVDLMKELLVGGVLGSALLAGVLALVRAFPDHWWLWVWGFYLAFTLVVQYLSPYVLEPLFNRFTPVPEALAGEVRALSERAGIRVGKVFQMDASRRSRHTNAYFTGLGRVKRIVLYDTLLAKLETPEVLAVLAHEAGHWRGRHVLKRLAASALISLGVLYALFLVLRLGAGSGLFGLPAGAFLGQAVFALFMVSFLSRPFLPLLTLWSRCQERAADRFATRLLGTGEPLRQALIKLTLDNLSNLWPHPWYAAVYYSHPPILKRLRDLQK